MKGMTVEPPDVRRFSLGAVDADVAPMADLVV